MAFFRILLDIHLVDLLVEADSEEEAIDKVANTYRNFRPFGGRARLTQYRVRKPWKHQLKTQEEVK